MLGALMMTACQSAPKYSIEGNIANYEGRILLLAPNADGSADTLGNVVSVQGEFQFTGEAPEPRVAEIVPVNSKLKIPVFLEKGQFQVSADIKNKKKYVPYTVSGGGELQQIRSLFAEKEQELSELRDSLYKEYAPDYDLTANWGRRELRGILSQVDTLYEKEEDEFIKKYDNMVSANLIYNRLRELSKIKRIHEKYPLLGENAKASVQGKLLKTYYDREKNLVVGGTVPNFTLKTPDGEEKSLYDVKAKVKILDFWASWCAPCRAESPNVRRIYHKYKDQGLEVVSVSLDMKLDAWKKAIEDDQLPWTHLSDLKGWNSVVVQLYGIFGVPYMFVLDENNKILSEGLRGQKLDDFIGEHLK